MMIRRRHNTFFLLIAVFLLYSSVTGAQLIKYDENEPAKKFSPISLVFNRIFSSSGLDSFYQKLQRLKKTGKGVVSIVHIGDSHVQSGFFPSAVQKGFQDFFGNAGRGTSSPKELPAVSTPGNYSGVPDPPATKQGSGVIYHAIGVNGARFDSYNKSADFWEKLPALNADLFIVSLGTNDAQGNEFNESEFQRQLNLLLDKLKKASPGAAVLFTTAADSFKNGYPNRELWNLNISLFGYCTGNSIPVWDLYRVSNGFGSAYNWIKKGMMDADGVHYTARAYDIQGTLLFQALAAGYNNYVSSY